MDFSFDSVGKFLQQVQGAKAKDREAIEERLGDMLDDPHTYVIPPAFAKALDDLVEQHGDEAFKQIAMVTIAKWLNVHQEVLDEHIANEDMQGAIFTGSDIGKLNTALNILDGVGSFGGDEDYLKALRKELNQAVIDKLEETGRTPEQFLNEEGSDLRELL
jgi:hypothetical protein